MTVRGLQQPPPSDSFPNYAPAWWYSLAPDAALLAGAVLVASTLVLVPCLIRRRVSVQQLGARITTLAAGGNIQLGVYGARAIDNQPTGQAIMRTANIATDAAGAVASAVLNVAGSAGAPGIAIDRGLYWFGVNADASAGGTAIMQVSAAAAAAFAALVGSATQSDISSAAAVASLYRKISATFGTWPDLTSATFTNGLDQAFAVGQMQVSG